MEITISHDTDTEITYSVKSCKIEDSGLIRLSYEDGTGLVIAPHAYRSVELPKREGGRTGQVL